VTSVETFENVLAVPSYHYDPVFAAAVQTAFATFNPTAVALELPDDLTGEIAWALSCWPGPVCSVSSRHFVPFVPGDSILEAYRLARRHGVPVSLIDLRTDEPIQRREVAAPGAECAPRVGPMFRETVDALEAAAGPPAAGDVRREGFMAARLAQLMAEHERVLWVGGMGHWGRIRARLASGMHASPTAMPPASAPQPGKRRFVRLRLAPSALMQATARLPYLVARYGRNPERYDESDAIRELAGEALVEHPDRQVTLVIPGQNRLAEQLLLPEAKSSADVIRVLLYARNLAATRGVGDRPGLPDLLTAASAVIGNRFAGRLYMTAMEERPSDESRRCAPLTYEVKKRKVGYRAHNRWLDTRPFPDTGVAGQMRMIRVEEVELRAGDAPYTDLPAARKSDRLAWVCYPPDEEAYEAFIRYVLRLATIADAGDGSSAPFVAGMRDGVDARETIRHWHDGTVFVRERAPHRLQVTNALVDFTNEVETSDLLQGREVDPGGSKGWRYAGWADPSSPRFGSASVNYRYDVLQEKPCLLQTTWRELSLLTLDCPNWIEKDDTQSFYGKVIRKLVDWPRDRDLYAWLDVMFEFCRGKPFGYFSRYRPSTRIEQIAAKHRVRLVYVPLGRLPAALLERNRSFRFFHMTRKQWEALVRRVAETRGAWAVG
jgi:hypothetical protein